MLERIELIKTCDRCEGKTKVSHKDCEECDHEETCQFCYGEGELREEITIEELARLITNEQAREGNGP